MLVLFLFHFVSYDVLINIVFFIMVALLDIDNEDLKFIGVYKFGIPFIS